MPCTCNVVPCMHATACMQSRSRKHVHVEEHACNLDLAKCMWQSMHATTWLKIQLTRSIYKWHLHACERLRYFLMHFCEFCTRRHQSLLIASARLDFRQKLDSDFDPVFTTCASHQRRTGSGFGSGAATCSSAGSCLLRVMHCLERFCLR